MSNEETTGNRDQVNEPVGTYHTPHKKGVRIFKSVTEQEDEMISYWASITPVERLRHLHEMIIHAYGLTEEKLKNPKLGHSIRIVSPKP